MNIFFIFMTLFFLIDHLNAMENNQLIGKVGNSFFNKEEYAHDLLYKAAVTADIPSLEKALKCGVNVNDELIDPQFPDKKSRGTALLIAIQEARDTQKRHARCRNTLKQPSYIDFIKRLLQVKGINVNLKNFNGYTPLHIAAHNNNESAPAIIGLLLGVESIDMNMQTSEGNTALHIASSSKGGLLISDESAQKLINAGISLHTKNNNNQTAMDISPFVQEEKARLVDELLKAIREGNIAHTKKLLQQIPFSMKDENKYTFLHHAVQAGNEDMVKLFLILQSALITESNNDGHNCVSLAIGNWPIVELLFEVIKGPSAQEKQEPISK